jgi:hypothetical protein
MTAVLHVFPDTNVFIQCTQLAAVDWSLLGDWEYIEVVVCAPVQAELDALKGKGNGRQASRARNANSLLGKLLEPGVEHLVLSDKPRVHVTVRVELVPDAEAAGTLPNTRDNELVTTALAYQRAHSEVEVRLLTNDNGPMFSAKRVGLTYIKVPSAWRLPPEPDESEKREAMLKERVAQLERSEPSFETVLTGYMGERFEASVTLYEALSDTQVAALVTGLVERFPKATDFGPTQPDERRPKNDAYGTFLFGASKEVFTPAAEKEIAAYREAYDAWKAKCEERLSELHKALNSALECPLLTATITNTGSRPAQDALVVIEVQGDFWLMPPKKRDEDDDDVPATEAGISLPRPPVAPKGTWKTVHGGLVGLHEQLASIHAGSLGSLLETLHTPNVFRPLPRDPNSFYWKEGRRGMPSKRLELTCEQWRHARAPEDFQQFVLCPAKPGEHTGLLTVSVHAANLTRPNVTKLTARITRTPASCVDFAERLINEL